MWADHRLAGGIGREIEDNAEVLRAALHTHDVSQVLLREWEAHAEGAQRRGVHPFNARGYDDLVTSIGKHAREAGARLPAPLAGVLEAHEPLVRTEREAEKLASRIDDCLRRREEVLQRAHEELMSSLPVAELGRPHARWRRSAARALEAGRELLGNETYAVHVDAAGRRDRVERAVARIEGAALLDHLPVRAVRAWEDLRARESDRHRFFLPEHERACKAMYYGQRRIKDPEAERFAEEELAMRKRMTAQAQRLGEVAGRIESAAAEREGTDERFLLRERYGAWRHQTEQAVADARGLLHDRDLAPHFEEDPELRDKLETASAALGRTLREEAPEWERVRKARIEEAVREERRQQRRQGRSWRITP